MNKVVTIMGNESKTISGYNLTAVVAACVPFIERGWYVHEHRTRRQWPLFWIVEHEAEIHRDFIAEVPEHQFAYTEKIL